MRQDNSGGGGEGFGRIGCKQRASLFEILAKYNHCPTACVKPGHYVKWGSFFQINHSTAV